jgi:ribosomal protein L33
MARKKTQILFKLLSSLSTNATYFGSKHHTKHMTKLSTLKFDPHAQQYAVFN